MSGVDRAGAYGELVAAARGELVDSGGLVELAEQVAGRQAAQTTRKTYASVYRSFLSWLGPNSAITAVDASAVRGWRDELEHRNAAPATVAKHLSALRQLAAAAGADAAVREVKGQRVGRGIPRALTEGELERLLRMPDRRRTAGLRDLALLHLLAHAGLRRAEACRLQLSDVDGRARASTGDLRRAVADSTAWWVTVRGKGGRVRRVPLTTAAIEALTAWVRVRPSTSDELVFCSLPRTGRPPAPLDPRDVGRIVTTHATSAGLPEDRRGPHVLRHTFCTHLAARGVGVEVIRELAGHADIRTTTIYTAIGADRLEAAVLDQPPDTGLGRFMG